MNLILTDKCTNSCPYCFAAQEMSRNKRKNNMKREDFDYLMHFISNSKEQVEINVIGGEPLIYDDLEYVLKRLNRSRLVKNICVMTGGIIKKQVFDILLKYQKKLTVLFNVNEKASYLNAKHIDIVRDCIKYSISLGLKVSFGFNIYHHNFNGREIINLCKQYGVSHLRFAIACPIYGSQHNVVVPSVEYQKLSKRVFLFLRKCFESGIEANLDCPIPMCFFSNYQLGAISKMHPQIISRLGKCSPPIDINYDLKLFRCFSIGKYRNEHLSNFKSFDEIRNYFINEIDSRLNKPFVFPKCNTCINVEKCNGGCLSNNTGFLSNPNKIERIQEVLNLSSNNLDNEALALLEQEYVKNDIDLFLLAQLYYNIGNMAKARTYCYKAIHESSSLSLRKDVVNLLNIVEEVL